MGKTFAITLPIEDLQRIAAAVRAHTESLLAEIQRQIQVQEQQEIAAARASAVAAAPVSDALTPGPDQVSSAPASA